MNPAEGSIKENAHLTLAANLITGVQLKGVENGAMGHTFVTSEIATMGEMGTETKTEQQQPQHQANNKQKNFIIEFKVCSLPVAV